MINLLPTEVKQEISYARRNTLLLRWIAAIVVALIGCGLIIGAGQLYLRQSISTYSGQVEQARVDLEDQQFTETQKQLEDVSGNLKLVLEVLNREILFSNLLQQLGASTPAGVALAELQIEQPSGGLSISAKAESFEKATQLQLNLQDPNNRIFEKADIENIECGNEDESAAGYPCSVRIRALFAKENPFLFINSVEDTD